MTDKGSQKWKTLRAMNTTTQTTTGSPEVPRQLKRSKRETRSPI